MELLGEGAISCEESTPVDLTCRTGCVELINTTSGDTDGKVTPAILHGTATPECTKWWVLVSKPTLAGLTFENCCLAERMDFWQPLPGLWRGVSPEGSRLAT